MLLSSIVIRPFGFLIFVPSLARIQVDAMPMEQVNPKRPPLCVFYGFSKPQERSENGFQAADVQIN